MAIAKTATTKEPKTIKAFIDSKQKLNATLVPSTALKTIVSLGNENNDTGEFDRTAVFCIMPAKNHKVKFDLMDFTGVQKDLAAKVKTDSEITLSVPHTMWGADLLLSTNKLVAFDFTVRELDFKFKEAVRYRRWLFPNVYDTVEEGICFGDYTPASLRSAYNYFFNSKCNLELTNEGHFDEEDVLINAVNELEDCEDLSQREKNTLIKNCNTAIKNFNEAIKEYFDKDTNEDHWEEDEDFFGENYVILQDCDGVFISESSLIPENFKIDGKAIGSIKEIDEDTWEVTVYKDNKNQITFKLPTDRVRF